MENQTITQQEISQMTGLPLPTVSEALFTAKPVSKNGRVLVYQTRDALAAIIQYSQRKRQIIIDAAARKTAKWENIIDALSKRLGV